MGSLVITGIAALGAIFMTVFFVMICIDGSKIKMCEVFKVDTDPAGAEASEYSQCEQSVESGARSRGPAKVLSLDENPQVNLAVRHRRHA
jgi:hypothetical protein